ncbi:IS5 family transposase [Dactylosporangium sp. CS-033363]|uniref:IS5 family transposase n=1 Tax=Dactylosporangium sp. CS-033363 TaxID=3239935 RepID=UPI003D909D13
MPVLPSSLLEPIWIEFAALLPERGEYDPTHPLGCHRRRVPDRVVFEHVIAALVHGSGYERIAGPGCSDSTIRRRLRSWAAAGLGERVHALVLAAFDRMIGLQLTDLAVDGCITKAVSGGAHVGRSPVDRGKGGRKRSVVTDGGGVPLGVVAAGANRHDGPLLGPTLDAAIDQVGPRWPDLVTVHLDAGYDSIPTRHLLAGRGWTGRISRRGRPAPVQAGRRWVVEADHAWMNGFGKLRRHTDRHPAVIDFYHYLAAAIVTLRALIRRARTHYRWTGMPTTRRLQ